MTTNNLLPWHSELFTQWHNNPNKSHAYLIMAQEHTGGEILLQQLANSVLCENPSTSKIACGQCTGCQLLAAHSHPDFRIIRPSILDINHPIEELRPEKPSKEIRIAQVRELTNMVNQTSHRGGMRVILIYPANKLNTNAANALLKTLEEPNAHTLFFLLANDIKQLLPTIVSRCLRINAKTPDIATAIHYLNQHIAPNPNWAEHLTSENRAVLRVAQLHETHYFSLQNQLIQELTQGKRINPLRLAETYEKHIKDADKARLLGKTHTLDISTIITWLQRWTHDLALCTQDSEARYYPQYKHELRQLITSINLFKLHQLHTQLLKEQQYSERSLNIKLWLEKLFLTYTQTFLNPT